MYLKCNNCNPFTTPAVVVVVVCCLGPDKGLTAISVVVCISGLYAESLTAKTFIMLGPVGIRVVLFAGISIEYLPLPSETEVLPEITVLPSLSEIK